MMHFPNGIQLNTKTLNGTGVLIDKLCLDSYYGYNHVNNTQICCISTDENTNCY